MPWAVEQYQDKPQLIPIHHSTVELNNHTGANVAGSLAGSFFYKPKATTELAGAHARTRLHSKTPVFYVFAGDDSDGPGETDKSLTQTWAIVGGLPVRDRRVFSKIQFTQLAGKAKRDDGNVRTQIEKLGGGWYRLTPAVPLEPGEYAISPVFKSQAVFATVVYDFGVEPGAPNAPDAISAAE